MGKIESLQLFKLFGQIHNHIYANEGMSPQEALNEFIKILFIKLETERKEKLKDDFIISNEDYKKVLEGEQQSFKKRIENLFNQVKRDYPDIFLSSDTINLKDNTLAFVIMNLQDINFDCIDDDIKGIAFQKFIFANQRGDRGQFITPNPLIELAVNFIKPTSHDKIIDPACGTGGFLIRSLRYIKKNNKEEKLREFFDNLKGIEINPSVTRICKIRMILEGDGHGGIFNADSLSDFKDLEKLGNIPLKGEFDLVLTNPPFGSQGKITDKQFLKRFKLGYIWKRNKDSSIASENLQPSQPPEVLFIERCIDFLKNKGKIAIVLPDGILENKTMRYIRDYIRENTKILAIVSLPSKTFIPHGTGVKTSILFLEKKDEKDRLDVNNGDYDIFFSIIQNVGYAGNKNATPLYKKNENGDLILDEDISTVIGLYNKFKEGSLKIQTDLGFVRKFSELDDRIDVEFYQEKFRKLEDNLRKKGAIPLGELVEIKSKKADVMKHPNKEIGYIEITNINSSTSEIINSQDMKVSQAPSRASYELTKGDIITSVAGVSVGTENHATAYVSEEFEGSICTNGFRVLVPKKINPYYLLYYLRSDLFLSQMLRYRTGAAIPSVIEEDLRKILVLIPSNEEEDKIVKIVKESYDLREKAKKMINNINHKFF